MGRGRIPDVSERPYVVLSCAMSLDGYIDDTGPQRLLLSNREDLERVDAERARSDAILVGAGTLRRDDPALRVRSNEARHERLARGLRQTPIRATITDSGALDPGLRFFAGEGPIPLVYCSRGALDGLRLRLEGKAEVVDAGDPLDLRRVLRDLRGRGVSRLMVEGGSMVLTQFLAEDLADELHLAVAPILVGDSRAPRFVTDAEFPHGPANHMILSEARQIGDVVLLRYLL
jgi:5-amino-6-(5-phosphoribosylamino)uracil reductase